jgi:tetratricopeptide (TPR) repeat protein
MTNKVKDSDADRLESILGHFIDAGEVEKAAVIAGLLDDPDCTDPERWLLLGRQAMQAGNLRLAETHFEKSLQLGGQNPALFFGISNVLFLLGEDAQAVTWAIKTIDAVPNFLKGYFHLARIHASNGRIAKTILVLQNVLDSEVFTEQDKNEAHKRLGVILMKAYQYEEAIPHLQKALLLGEDEASIWKDLGHCESRMGDLEGALEAFRNAVERNPSPSNLYELGDCLIGLGRNEEAIAVLEKAATQDPDHVMVNYDLSLAYFNEERYEEGAAAARRALADDPEMKLQLSNPALGATANLGVCLLNLNLLEESLACFDRNIKMIASSYFNKGLALFRMRRPEDAVACFKKVLEINPDDTAALNLLGQSLGNAGQYVQAVVSLKKAIKLDPKYAVGYYDLGIILGKKKDKRAEAMRCFKKALSLQPDAHIAAWVLYSIAGLHAVAGRREEAFRFLEQALERGLRERDHIDADKDLDRLRRDPRFTELMRKYFAG